MSKIKPGLQGLDSHLMRVSLFSDCSVSFLQDQGHSRNSYNRSSCCWSLLLNFPMLFCVSQYKPLQIHCTLYFIAVGHSVTLSSSKPKHANEHDASVLLFEMESAMLPLTYKWALRLYWEQGWWRSRRKSRHCKGWFNMSGELELATHQQSSLLQLTQKYGDEMNMWNGSCEWE